MGKKIVFNLRANLANNIAYICSNWSVLSKATIWDFYNPALDGKGNSNGKETVTN